MNRVYLMGHLGRDPEARQVNGETCVKLAVATNRTYRDRAGAERTDVEWHRVVVWGAQAEACRDHLRKGRQVVVEGSLRTTKFVKAGVDTWATEVVAQSVHFAGGAPVAAPDKGGK